MGHLRKGKTERIIIKCSPETAARFKSLARELRMTYEGLLLLLLNTAEDELRLLKRGSVR